MEMRTFINAGIIALAVIGASGWSGCKKKTGAASMTAVPICARFTELTLPTEGGVVWFCQGNTMRVLYDGGDPHALGTKYEGALLAHGWVRKIPVNEVTWQWLGVYVKDQESMTVTVERADFSGKVPGGEQVLLVMSTPAPPAH